MSDILKKITELLLTDDTAIFELLIDTDDSERNQYVKFMFTDGLAVDFIGDEYSINFNRYYISNIYTVLMYINHLDMYDIDMPDIITHITNRIIKIQTDKIGTFGMRGFNVFKKLVKAQSDLGRTAYIESISEFIAAPKYQGAISLILTMVFGDDIIIDCSDAFIICSILGCINNKNITIALQNIDEMVDYALYSSQYKYHVDHIYYSPYDIAATIVNSPYLKKRHITDRYLRIPRHIIKALLDLANTPE